MKGDKFTYRYLPKYPDYLEFPTKVRELNHNCEIIANNVVTKYIAIYMGIKYNIFL